MRTQIGFYVCVVPTSSNKFRALGMILAPLTENLVPRYPLVEGRSLQPQNLQNARGSFEASAVA